MMKWETRRRFGRTVRSRFTSRRDKGQSMIWKWLSMLLGIALIAVFCVYEPKVLVAVRTAIDEASKRALISDLSGCAIQPTGARFTEQQVASTYKKLARVYLKPFRRGISRESYRAILDRATYAEAPEGAQKGVQTVLCQIKDGRIYVHDPYSLANDEKGHIRSRLNELVWLLRQLVEQRSVADTEFLVAVHDCVQTVAMTTEYRAAQYAESNPVFTIVGCNFSHNIPIPMWERDFSRGGGYENWQTNMEDYAQDDISWEDKMDKGVFRGTSRPSMLFKDRDEAQWNCEIAGRSRLAWLARDHTDILDVGLEGVCNNTEHFERLEPKDQHRYKFTIQAEGNCFWADRINRLLFGPSAILKQQTPCGQFFEPLLSPMGHFIPVDFFFNDLVEKVQWAKDPENEDAVRRIVNNANDFAWSFLTTSAFITYFDVLLQEYTSLLENRTIVVEEAAEDWTNRTLS